MKHQWLKGTGGTEFSQFAHGRITRSSDSSKGGFHYRVTGPNATGPTLYAGGSLETAETVVTNIEAEAEHLKAPADYTFEANRFYGPGERYSSGSGLSSSGLTLAQAKAHFDTYDVGGHTYCLTVTAPDGAVIHHKGPSKADTTRSMNAAYRRRNDPVDAKPTTTVQNLRRAQAALQNMPYGGMMRLPRVDDKMTAALAVQEMTVALEVIRETLKGVGERHAADTAELERLRKLFRGGADLFAELSNHFNGRPT